MLPFYIICCIPKYPRGKLMATTQLPPPRNIFPLKMPYMVRSDMYKIGQDTVWL